MLNEILLDVSWSDKWLVYSTAAIPVITIVIAFMANNLAHKYWRKQKHEEINYQLEGVRAQGRLEQQKLCGAYWLF